MKIIRHTVDPLELLLNDFKTGSIDKFLDDMDKHFQNLMNWEYPIKGKILSSGFPRTDIVYNEDVSTLSYICDIPGWDKENIDISIDETTNCFTISGKKSEERRADGQLLLHERKSTGFKRTFPLPLLEEIDLVTEISAKFENGQLYITVPLLKKVMKQLTNKKIEIK